jgi:hypothetical protein
LGELRKLLSRRLLSKFYVTANSLGMNANEKLAESGILWDTEVHYVIAD